MKNSFKNLAFKAIAVILLAALLAGCSFFGPQDESAIDQTTSTDQEKTEEVIAETSGSTLGEMEYKEPEEAALIEYDGEETQMVPVNMFLVLADEGTNRAEIEAIAADLGGEIVGEFDFIDLYQIETDSTTQEELDALTEQAKTYDFVTDSGVMLPLWAQNVEGKACKILDDIYTDKKASSAYEMIGLERAWALIKASGIKLNKVKVGVVDTGYNDESADGKKGTKIQALNKEDKKDAEDDYNTHGTAVANTIGASWENGGMRGVAGGLEEKLQIDIASLTKEEKSFKPIATGDPNDPTHYIESDGTAYIVNNLAEIKKQIDNGAEVINYSWGFTNPDPKNEFHNKIMRKFLDKMQKAHPKVVFVAAACNGGYKKVKDPVTNQDKWVKGTPLNGKNNDMGGTPADNLITVGSVDSDGQTSWFSNTVTEGGEITLAAQGNEVALGYNKDGSVYYANGTSFATPQVSGAVAILKSINPDLTAKEIKDILTSTADTKITNPNLLPEGKTEQAISDDVGGKVMRLDKAVAKALKQKMGDKFDESKIEKISTITASASPDKEDPLHFTIEANIPEVFEGGTDVTVTFTGEGSLGGMSEKHISAPGALTWDWRFISEKNSAQIKITREDSGACTTLILTPETIAGTYTGAITVFFPEYASFMSKTTFVLPAEMVIDNENNLTLTYETSDSSTYGASGFTGTLKFTSGGTMKGRVAEDKSLTFTGDYYSDYQNIIPGEYMAMMPAEYKAQLSGRTTGNVNGSGQIVQKEITGTVDFVYMGTASGGTFSLSKVE